MRYPHYTELLFKGRETIARAKVSIESVLNHSVPVGGHLRYTTRRFSPALEEQQNFDREYKL